MIKIIKARKYGFCSGVRTAVLKVERFARDGKKGAILGQIVHNERVVEKMEKLGMRTVEEIKEVKEPYIIFSAHGVPPSYYDEALKKGLNVVDASCKFVLDIHKESLKAFKEGYHLVFIGDPTHREVIGYTHDLSKECYHIVNSVKQAKKIDFSKYEKIKIFYQTTLNSDDYEEVVDEIKKKNKNVEITDTICYATKQNQECAKELAENKKIDLIFVIGGKMSANTRHLYEICTKYKKTFLIQGCDDIKKEYLEGVKCVGLTAGASTPDKVVEEVEKYLKQITSE
jgi:4-hydroxy-3-methylbut-2-enyl diphosphate reductase